MEQKNNFKLGKDALLVSFMRVKVGKEFDLVNKISEGRRKPFYPPSYFTCYGQYDLVELQMIDSFEGIPNVPTNSDILDCEFSLFYSIEGFSIPVHTWTADFPVLVLALLNIHPEFEKLWTFDIEYSLISFIKQKFPKTSNIFLSLGRSEIFLILGGDGFGGLFSEISNLRQNLRVGEIMKDSRRQDPRIPIFTSSTSFPIISHSIFHSNSNERLSGNVLPRVNVMCEPGCEHVAVSKKPPSCSRAYNIYGNYDVALIWDKPVKLSQFWKELTDFRQSMIGTEGIIATQTNLYGQEIIQEDTRPAEIPKFKKSQPTYHFNDPGFLEKTDLLDTLRRDQLIEFIMHLNTCLGRSDSSFVFTDMIRITRSIEWAINELRTADEVKRDSIFSLISEIIDLGNNGLYQRYAGLETRFEPFKPLPFPFLRGINAYITAASSIPCFIIKSLYPELPVHDAWDGFVLFGLSYSYQLLPGRIISYPASTLTRPIEDWWGISHEVAHAFYHISHFYEKELPQDVKDHLEAVPAARTFKFSIDIEELFANWFDFSYIFRGDKNRYFPIIWKSWLRWERISRYRLDYLGRSFVIFLCTDLDGFFKARTEGNIEEYLRNAYSEMINLIISKIPSFKEFAAEIPAGEITGLPHLYTALYPLLVFLQRTYLKKEVFERMHPFYSEKSLKDHIECLEQGIVITDNVPDVLELLHKLYDKYAGGKIPFHVTGAFLLTLWNFYIKNYLE